MEYSPIVLFVYNRLENVKKTIDALKANPLASQSNLIIVSDGAKNNTEDEERVNNVRNYCRGITGFASVRIKYRRKNVGLARNIITGLDMVFQTYDRAIILEDDIVTSPSFLEYMNTALEKYSKKEEVMAISGYVEPFDKTGLDEAFFLPWFACWGWATWRTSWNKFERNPKKLIRNTSYREIKAINVNDTAPDIWEQVLDNYRGRRRTWAVFNYVLICKEKGKVLYPNQSLCNNIGFDGSGTNCDDSNAYYVAISEAKMMDQHLPDEICVSKIGIERMERFNRIRTHEYGIKWNVLVRLRSLVFCLYRRML